MNKLRGKEETRRQGYFPLGCDSLLSVKRMLKDGRLSDWSLWRLILIVSAGKSVENIFKGWNCIIRSISNPSCSHSLIMNQVDQNLCISELHHSLLSLGVASPPLTTLTANTPSARHTQLLALFHLLSTDSCVSSFSQGDPLLAVSCFHGSYTQGIPTSLFSLLPSCLIYHGSFFLHILVVLYSVLCLGLFFFGLCLPPHTTLPLTLSLCFLCTQNTIICFWNLSWWVYEDVYINRHVSFFIISKKLTPPKKKIERKKRKKLPLYIHTYIQMYVMCVCGNLVTRVCWTAPPPSPPSLLWLSV